MPTFGLNKIVYSCPVHSSLQNTIIYPANDSRNNQRGALKGGRGRWSGLRLQKWRNSMVAGHHMTSKPAEGCDTSQVFPNAQPSNRGSPGRFIFPHKWTKIHCNTRWVQQVGSIRCPTVTKESGDTVFFPTGPMTHLHNQGHHAVGRHLKRKCAKIRRENVKLD